MGVSQILIINPRSDAEFVRLVDGLAESVSSPTDLQEALRDSHPSALVRARDLSGEARVVWYVYRDGRWVPPNGGSRGGHE